MRKSQHTSEYRKLMAVMRQAREKAGVTQGQVAKRLGTYASFISKSEAGERRLDILEFLSLCRLYQVEFNDVLKLSGIIK